MALPKANRLRSRQDFKDVYHRGIRKSGRYLTLRALPYRQRVVYSPKTEENIKLVASIPTAETKPPTRLGISISQKVSKRAVIRNRIKRWIRAATLQLLPQLSPGWRLVVVVGISATECDYAEILRELEQLLRQAEVINGN